MSTQARWLLAALLPLAACTAGPAVQLPGAGRASQTDRAFVVQAAQADAFAVQSSDIALQKARRPAVRAYARQIVDAHTAATQTLTAIAGRKDIVLPAAMDPAQQLALANLRANDRGFDAAYVAAQTEAHRSAILAYQSEVATGADADVRAFAQAALPELQAHLATAQRLRGGR